MFLYWYFLLNMNNQMLYFTMGMVHTLQYGLVSNHSAIRKPCVWLPLLSNKFLMPVRIYSTCCVFLNHMTKRFLLTFLSHVISRTSLFSSIHSWLSPQTHALKGCAFKQAHSCQLWSRSCRAQKPDKTVTLHLWHLLA